MAALCSDDSISPTDRLYLPSLAGNFTHSSTSTLLSVSFSPGSDQRDGADCEELVKLEVAFDKSPFHPQGGGQPSDIGRITSPPPAGSPPGSPLLVLTVVKVTYDFTTKVVTHACTAPSSSSPSLSLLAKGVECELSVDAAHRELLSKFHSAGHLVDSAIYGLGYDCLVPQKGYHFLDGPYVEYGNGKQIPEAERKTLPARLNVSFEKLIAADIPTTICMMAKDDAEAELNGTAREGVQKNFDLSAFTDPEVRIVGIAGFRCPCGGTHVPSTSSLKDFEVTGIKMKKGDLRVKYGKKKL